MISLQPLHLTQRPSGTWIRLCSTGCLGFLIFLNQAISISSRPSRGVNGQRVARIISPPGGTVKNSLLEWVRARPAESRSTAQTRDMPRATPGDDWTHSARLLFFIQIEFWMDPP